jgi:hypothetical protein
MDSYIDGLMSKSASKEQEFKSSLRALSEAVLGIAMLLNQPAETVSSSALGSRLVALLNSIRLHRHHAIALASHFNESALFTQYLDKLRVLRGSVAQWLTIHAVQPELIYMELHEFESQAWSALGIGMVLLDNCEFERQDAHDVMPSRFHHWWKNLDTRPSTFAV